MSRLAELNRERDELSGEQLAGRRLAAVLPVADAEARKLGLLIDWKAPEARPVLLDCLRAVTPAAPEKLPAPKLNKLRDVFTRWKGVKARSEDSLKACERKLFEEHTGDTPVQQITRAQAFLGVTAQQRIGSVPQMAFGKPTSEGIAFNPAKPVKVDQSLTAQTALEFAASPTFGPGQTHVGLAASLVTMGEGVALQAYQGRREEHRHGLQPERERVDSGRRPEASWCPVRGLPRHQGGNHEADP